jgi:hypothetical protein
VCDYEHLNPAQARFAVTGTAVAAYRWSSWLAYLNGPGQRPVWLRVDRLLGEYRIPRDSAASRRHLTAVLELRCFAFRWRWGEDRHKPKMKNEGLQCRPGTDNF